MVSEVSQKNEQIRDEIDPKILDKLQANILKAHGRDEAYHLFLRFTTRDKDKVKAWIRAYAQNYVTSAAKQLEDARKRRDSIEKKDVPVYSAGLLGCFFLSAAGYKFLDFSTEPFEDSFRAGMKDRQNYILDLGTRSYTIRNKDPLPGDWQEEYQDEIHAMLLLAQNDNDPGPSLKEKVANIEKELTGIAKVVVKEHGIRDINGDGGDPIEHFGYRDGISNPLFFKNEIAQEQRDRYDPSAPLNLVLVKDPLTDEANYGSYLVFRKLRQDVKGFEAQVAELSRQVNQGDMELTGAQIIGRFRDGTPITTYNSPQGPKTDTNDFNFDTDDGRRCPVHAHIRKVNPRDPDQGSRRIVRRGIPYGKRGDDEVGLLFMCYQRNIHDQFEFIQRIWIDNRNHPGDNPGQDRLVGQDKTTAAQPHDHPEASKEGVNFGRHITLQGGEYFFAPSLSFLKNIN